MFGSSSSLSYTYFEIAITVGLVLGAIIPLYFAVLGKRRGPERRRRRNFKGNFNPKDPEFLSRRAKSYPPPYPNGWFKLCDVDDLDNGNIVSVTAMGRDYVVFRARDSGAIGVLDAHCPHLGAHLGQGGTVVGDCIQCPFHAWRIATDGTAMEIPYSSAPPPAAAKGKSHIHTVWQGMVFVWFHADGEEPEYELAAMPQIAGWKRMPTESTTFNMHVTDMPENGADYYHFNFLHGPMPIPLVGRFFTTKFDTKLHFHDEKRKQHECFFTNLATVHLFGKHPLKFTQQKTVVTFEGPSIIHFSILTPLGGLHLIKTTLPVKPFQMYIEDTWFVEPKMNWLVAKIIMYIAKHALEQDQPVWESRMYLPKPVLVSGDGPFPSQRKWMAQFFSEGSKQAALAGREMDW